MVERITQTRVASSDQSLTQLVAAQLSTPGSAGASALAQDIHARFGGAVVGIIYYGSCFRTGVEDDGIIDLLVLVDDYRSAYRRHSGLAIANALLPPNVFYLEKDVAGRIVRTKYAVISLRDFVQRTSRRCFHTYFWARFAQPCALLYARDAQAEGAIVATLVAAITTFIERTVPAMPDRFDTTTLWTQGMLASYRSELRPERPAAAARLVDADINWYRLVTAAAQVESDSFKRESAYGDNALYAAMVLPRRRWLDRQAWRVRRVQGKLLNFLRILKAAFTFDGGVDYALWKIERHSGIRVEATPMLRKHPLLAGWGVLWRLYRRGAFR